MRQNEYQSFDDFYREYCGVNSDQYETYIGIEFDYKLKKYRMCLEPIGKYFLYQILGKRRGMPRLKVICTFDNFKTLLESDVIDKRPFKEVIMDDNTRITEKD